MRKLGHLPQEQQQQQQQVWWIANIQLQSAPQQQQQQQQQNSRQAPQQQQQQDAGLGQAEFARGNYRAAERDFQSALRLQPDDKATEQRLQLARTVLQLDPAVRGLSSAERFRRSLKVVEETADETGQCIGPTPPADAQALLERAAAVLKARVSAARESEVAESNLDLAEQMWQVRKKECKAPPAADSPLALVLARSAQ